MASQSCIVWFSAFLPCLPVSLRLENAETSRVMLKGHILFSEIKHM